MEEEIVEDDKLDGGEDDELDEGEEDDEAGKYAGQAYDTFSDDDIEDLFNKNTESFRCLAQILISRSSLLRHILYHYPPLEDPGIDDAFNYVEPEPVYDDIGIEKYKNLCKDYYIIPLRRVIESLPSKVMDLKFYGLTMLEVKTICTTLMLNAHVEVLILEDNWMSPEAAFYVGEALRENNSIKVLNLKECRIGPEGAQNLIEGLGLNQSLRELDLSYNDLGDEGLLHIISALEENQQVQKLNLSHNHLSDASGKALGLYLKENASTDYLDLSWNDYRALPGLKDLCNGLIANKSVTYLNLAWNGIATMDAVGPIVRFMRMSNKLEHLDLSCNRMMTPLLQAVRAGLLRSKSLISIKLGGNLITPSDAEILVKPLLNEGNPVTYMDLENVFVQKSFVPIWKKITNKGKSVRIEGILDNYVIEGPNKVKVIFERCKFLAQKPKKKKQKRDFGTFIYTLPNEFLEKKDMQALIKKYKMKLLDEDLIGGLCDMFKEKSKVNATRLKETYLNMYPDTVPPPPPKPKKTKGKKKGKKDKKGKKGKAEPQQEPTPATQQEPTAATEVAPVGEKEPTAEGIQEPPVMEEMTALPTVEEITLIEPGDETEEQLGENVPGTENLEVTSGLETQTPKVPSGVEIQKPPSGQEMQNPDGTSQLVMQPSSMPTQLSTQNVEPGDAQVQTEETANDFE